MYRQTFALTAAPFPKNARGKSFFTEYEGYKRLDRSFQMLCEEPGLGLLTADPGVGKTAAILTGSWRGVAPHSPVASHLRVPTCRFC